MHYYFPDDAGSKECACQCKRQKRCRFSPLVGKIPCRREQPPPVFLAGESQWTEEPGELESMGSQRVRHDCMTEDTHYLIASFFCSWGCRRTVLELRWSSPPLQEPEVSFSSAFLILLLLLSSLSSQVQLRQHIICSHNHFTRQRDCCSSFTVSVLRRKTISRCPSAQGRVSCMSPWPDLCHLSILH